MPRLGSLLVCEKIIVDQAQKPTLIALFQKMSAIVPEGQVVPKNTVAGASWSVFSEWFLTDSELTNQYEQVLEVVLPDGSTSPIKGRLALKEVAKDGMGTRTFINLFGMPIEMPGFVTVNVWLEVGSERVTDVFGYKIQVDHIRQAINPNDGGTHVIALAPSPELN